MQLKKCIFGSLSVTANDKAADDAEMPIETARHYAVSSTSNRLWKVGLEVTFGQKNDGASPYFGNVQVEGVFEVNPSYPESKMQELLAITGASILYGSVREMIASITARGPKGVFLMPSVSFYQMDKALSLPPPQENKAVLPARKAKKATIKA